MTTGEVIRRIRKSVGMTQTELGALINFSQPAVSGLERGGPASHDVRVLRLVARALGVPLAILVVESDREADVDRRNFFKAGASVSAGSAMMSVSAPANAVSASAGKVGASDVEAIIESVNQIHELDLVVGGDRLCRVAANQVRYVEQLLDQGSYTEAVGRSLTSAAAEMMTAAGWVHYDAGRLDDARRYYADAANAANAAGDGIAAAHALANASFPESSLRRLERQPSGRAIRAGWGAGVAPRRRPEAACFDGDQGSRGAWGSRGQVGDDGGDQPGTPCVRVDSWARSGLGLPAGGRIRRWHRLGTDAAR
ncbi:helix-turn-helix domain-containing protein [Nocardia araoensis]|uniref:helix-turn-helix domain-containing protein n=1 Tax=Nocardia araoensis TaxID=228600 RepID=UPI000A028C4A|nr:helix-turn-helix transcriptional regulator [Nocardia araoensis]